MTLSNLDLGPGVLIWDEAGANVTFDKSKDGIIFRYEELQAPIVRDQAGLTHVSDVTTGVTNPEIEIMLTEEEVAKLDAVFANSEVGANFLHISNPVGVNVFPLSRELIVKPIINGAVSATPAEWVYLYRCFPRVTMEQVYDNAGQRGVKVIFKGYPDDISGRQHRLWSYGPK